MQNTVAPHVQRPPRFDGTTSTGAPSMLRVLPTYVVAPEIWTPLPASEVCMLYKLPCNRERERERERESLPVSHSPHSQLAASHPATNPHSCQPHSPAVQPHSHTVIQPYSHTAIQTGRQAGSRSRASTDKRMMNGMCSLQNFWLQRKETTCSDCSSVSRCTQHRVPSSIQSWSLLSCRPP